METSPFSLLSCILSSSLTSFDSSFHFFSTHFLFLNLSFLLFITHPFKQSPPVISKSVVLRLQHALQTWMGNLLENCWISPSEFLIQ